MERLLLIRYGEIYLKGLNRPFFENLLLKRIREALSGFEGATVKRGDGRFFVQGYANDEERAVIAKVKNVFGLHSISPAVKTDKDFDTVLSVCVDLLKSMPSQKDATFKVEARRSDKAYSRDSMQIVREAGAYILDHTEGYAVDVRNPKIIVSIEIRDHAYCYTESIPCIGGMPIGSSGKAMLLLSGGIDSPVAGYMIAKRGVVVEAVHFHSFPYTGEKARQKVIDLAKIMTQYTGPIRLHIVHFTDIQMAIYEKCPHVLLTLIMRRFMMRIAEKLAAKNNAHCLVTAKASVRSRARRWRVFRPPTQPYPCLFSGRSLVWTSRRSWTMREKSAHMKPPYCPMRIAVQFLSPSILPPNRGFLKLNKAKAFWMPKL